MCQKDVQGKKSQIEEKEHFEQKPGLQPAAELEGDIITKFQHLSKATRWKRRNIKSRQFANGDDFPKVANKGVGSDVFYPKCEMPRKPIASSSCSARERFPAYNFAVLES